MAVSYINLKNAFDNKKFGEEIEVEVNKDFLDKHGLTPLYRAFVGSIIVNYDMFNREVTNLKDSENKFMSFSKIGLFKSGENTGTSFYWDIRRNDMEKVAWTRTSRYSRLSSGHEITPEMIKEVEEKKEDILKDFAPLFEDIVVHYGYEYEQVIEEDSLEIIQYILLMKHGKEKNTFKKVKRQSVKINADFNNLKVEKFSFSGSGARKNIVRVGNGDDIFFDTRATEGTGFATRVTSRIPLNIDELIVNGNKIWQKLGIYLKKDNPRSIMDISNPFVLIREYKEKESIIAQIDMIQEGSLYDNKSLKEYIKSNFDKDKHKAIRDIFGLTRKMEETLSNDTEKYVGLTIEDNNYSHSFISLTRKIKALRSEFGDISHDEIFDTSNFEAYKEYSVEVSSIQRQLSRYRYHDRLDTGFAGYLDVYKFSRQNRISMEDYLEYLQGLIWGEGIYSMSEAQTLLRDYWRMAHVLNMNVKRFPENLKAQHDKINIRHSFLVATETDKALGQQYSDFKEYAKGDFIMTFPMSSGDLISEGAELGHCVGSYVTRVAEGKTRVFFLRRKEAPETPYCTVELREDKVVQMKLKGNKLLNDDNALDFVSKWSEKYKAKVVGR